MNPVDMASGASANPYTNLLLASIPTVSGEDDRAKPDWPWDTAVQDS